MGAFSTSCLTVGGCSKNVFGYCNTLIVNDPDTNTSGCLSIIQSKTTNASGNACPAACSATGGCSGSTCLTCSCPSLSCLLSGSTNVCWCPTTGTATATTCTCPATSYFDGNQCLSCDSSCATCTQALLCTTCKAANSYLDTVQGCDCNPGYFGTKPLSAANSCTACYSECSTCNQALVCLTCKSTHASPAATGCLCDVGYGGVTPLVSVNSCVQCYSECATCSQADLCVTCVATKASPNGSQVCTCDPGYWGTAPLVLSSSCVKCYLECDTCNQADICLRCISGNASPSATQGCTCHPGYGGTSPLVLANSCTLCNAECSAECSTCDQGNLCLTCISANAVPSSCQGCICTAGYWGAAPLTSPSSCVQCYEECASCSQATACLSCIAENAAPSASGVCTCDAGYWGTAPLTSATSCQKCYSECKTCVGDMLCMSCVAISASPSATGGCTCNSGYWGVSPLSSTASCSPCDDQCITCNSQNICLECDLANASPVDSAGMGCECNPGYYQDSSTSTCLECPEFCKTCIDNSTCIVCNVTSSNPNTNGTCSCPFFSVETDYSCVCGYGYYMDDAGIFSCNPCHASCSTCRGKSDSDCILCAGLLSFDQNNKCSVCPEGKYDNNSVCEDCNIYCATCSDYDICLSCSDANKTINETGSCVNRFYANLTVEMVSGFNTLNVTFSDIPSRQLTASDFTITIPGETPSVSRFTTTNMTECSLQLSFPHKIPKGLEINITISSQLYSSSNIELSTYLLQGSLFAYNPLNSLSTVELIANSSSSAAKLSMCIAIGNAIVSNPAASWVIVNNLQLISYLPLNSNPLTPNLQRFCTSMGSYNVIPNYFQYVFDPNSTSAPYTEASNYGLSSSVFWINMGSDMTGITAIIIIFPVIFILSKIRVQRISEKASKYLQNYRYSVFLRFFIQTYLDLGIFALVQLISVINI